MTIRIASDELTALDTVCRLLIHRSEGKQTFATDYEENSRRHLRSIWINKIRNTKTNEIENFDVILNIRLDAPKKRLFVYLESSYADRAFADSIMPITIASTRDAYQIVNDIVNRALSPDKIQQYRNQIELIKKKQNHQEQFEQLFHDFFFMIEGREPVGGVSRHGRKITKYIGETILQQVEIDSSNRFDVKISHLDPIQAKKLIQFIKTL